MQFYKNLNKVNGKLNSLSLQMVRAIVMNKKQDLQKKAREKNSEMEKQWKICILTTVLAYERQIIRAKDIVHLMKQIRAMDMDVLFVKIFMQKRPTMEHTKSTEMTYFTIFSVCFEFSI